MDCVDLDMYMHELVNDEYFICYKKLATYMSKIIYKKLIHGTYVFFFLFLIIILARETCRYFLLYFFDNQEIL